MGIDSLTYIDLEDKNSPYHINYPVPVNHYGKYSQLGYAEVLSTASTSLGSSSAVQKESYKRFVITPKSCPIDDTDFDTPMGNDIGNYGNDNEAAIIRADLLDQDGTINGAGFGSQAAATPTATATNHVTYIPPLFSSQRLPQHIETTKTGDKVEQENIIRRVILFQRLDGSLVTSTNGGASKPLLLNEMSMGGVQRLQDKLCGIAATVDMDDIAILTIAIVAWLARAFLLCKELSELVQTKARAFLANRIYKSQELDDYIRLAASVLARIQMGTTTSPAGHGGPVREQPQVRDQSGSNGEETTGGTILIRSALTGTGRT